MRRGLIAIGALLVAGCGGSQGARETAASARSIGTARVATTDPRIGSELRDRRPAQGVVVGEPVLAALDLLPPVQLAARRSSCIGTELTPTTGNMNAVRSATLCLLNAERRARRLPPLRSNQRLGRASLLQARDMVARRYFSHTSRDGTDFATRIERTGYMQGARRWSVGENIAWGAGPLATPSEIVRSWMQSPPHKANILRGEFREIGIGVAIGVPVGGLPSGATYNTGFGVRV